jgi:uncharacterized protein (TIGR02147 family)
MSPRTIFDYRDYKAFLSDTIERKGHGERSRIAAALRCHLAYVSQVLNGGAQLSLEQADLLNTHLAHNEEESDFLLLLVGHARAGTESLRKRYEQRIRRVLAERARVEARLKLKKPLAPESRATYYSSWFYSAIHLLLSIPEFQTKDKIAQHLRLPMAQVTQALDFLVSTGLAEHSGGRYRTGQVTLHLENNSPLSPRHHSSWRMQAVQAIDRQDPANFHYTSVISMSPDDVPAVRKILVDAIEQIRAVVRSSPEEAIYCYSIDHFGF